MTRMKFLTSALIFALASLVWVPSWSQTDAAESRRSPRYDPRTEVTIRGVIEDIREHPSRDGQRTGQHVTLTTDGGSIDVHLGPTEYWQEHGFRLSIGAAVEVTGSSVSKDGKEVVIARQAKQHDTVVTLRNAEGVPAWSRAGRPE